jgi:hypothetical protein
MNYEQDLEAVFGKDNHAEAAAAIKAKASRGVIFAIDPGTTQSGWVLLQGGKVLDSGVDDNHDLLRWVKSGQRADVLAIETMQATYGTVGRDTIKTMMWAGRFQQAWANPEAVKLISRQAVKAAVCNGNTKASDAGVRQALLEIVGPSGRKKKPGPTYGVVSHAWAALAVAVAVQPGGVVRVAAL